MQQINRRQFVTRLALTGLALKSVSYSAGLSASPIHSSNAASKYALSQLSGSVMDLYLEEQAMLIDGKHTQGVLINGCMPGPTLYWREGDTVTIRVHNQLNEDTSIHWHGLLVPSNMDGVPGLSFSGIKPKSTFTYRFPLKQSGTYWYHSHSGWQEQLGMIGGLIIQPREPEPFKADREHVMVLSDWTFQNPDALVAKLKMDAGFDNPHLPDLKRFMRDINQQGYEAAIRQRKMWNQMVMSPTDYADLTAYSTFTYLLNGIAPDGNWTGLFNQGETLRLRVINASAQSIFDVRIPGLEMRIVGADGGWVEPVTVDEFRIGVAETYDVLIRPKEDAYTFFAQDISRSGYLRGTLAVREGLMAPIPNMDAIQWLSMEDMMGSMQTQPNARPVNHAQTEYGWSNEMRVDNPKVTLNDPGVNLRNNGRRVLTYADLNSITLPAEAKEAPSREIEMHLTGNMERYVWGFDGVAYADAKPVAIKPKERVRFTLVNDTMMTHPMHLHGMWSDLQNPDGQFQVRKHTIMVQPAQQISYDVTGEVGRWAWHCHLMYHMEMGMFREVAVVGGDV